MEVVEIVEEFTSDLSDLSRGVDVRLRIGTDRSDLYGCKCWGVEGRDRERGVEAREQGREEGVLGRDEGR